MRLITEIEWTWVRRRDAQRLVGEMAAGVPDPENKIDPEMLYKKLMKGFTKGTSDSDTFKKSYEEHRVKILQKKENP